MLITPFVRKDYFTVSAYQGTNQIRQTIVEHGSALVISDDAKPVGIITAHDLANRQHNLVIDCLTDKPKLTNEHLIPDVLTIMNKAHTDVLLVYENEELAGVIHKTDITDYLCRSLEQQKTLVHSIAHDLKNPLSNVLNATYLLKDTDNESEHQELLNLAQQACNYATAIINDILFSDARNREPLNKEVFNINDLLNESLDFFKLTIQQKEIQLSMPTRANEYYLNADRIKLKRAINNLISNAIKFTPPGGTISIFTKQLDDQLQVIIKDTGIGISTEMQPFIFDKYTHAKRRGTNGEGSTGLGMYITKQIIEQHHGKIRLESIEGQGTTFFIELPE